MMIDPPSLCDVQPLDEILKSSRKTFNGGTVERCLVFAPDAIGNHLFEGYPSFLTSVAKVASQEVFLSSVMPTVTPTCFASIFTGAEPAQHGVRKYEKPALKCDTLFDSLIRAGKSVAIVAVKDSSIDSIFRGRAIDYFAEEYDAGVRKQVISLLRADKHDFIVAYHQEYDDKMHATTPFDPAAIRAAEKNIASFVEIGEAFDEHWSEYNRAIVFAPDHGAHIDPATGKGSHGTESSNDMEMRHFYGLRTG